MGIANLDEMKYENTWALLTLQRWEEGVERKRGNGELLFTRGKRNAVWFVQEQELAFRSTIKSE